MERKHKNLRDVGLALCTLQAGGSRPSRAPLRCGRVLRCGVIDGCTWEELRRPATVVNLRMGEDLKDHVDASLKAAGVRFFHVPAENRLEKYDTANVEVQAWLQDVFRVFESEDVGFPVLVHCRSGKDRTGVVMALLLSLLGVPEALIVREFLLSEGAEDARIRESLAGFRKAGGAAAYLAAALDVAGAGGPVDVERVRERLASGEETEIKWLRQEVELMCRLAQAASKAMEPQEAAYWHVEAAAAAAELGGRVPPGDAAVALLYRGWALSQQLRYTEAREALTVGAALARLGAGGGAAPGELEKKLLKRLERELAALPEEEDGRELQVVELAQASEQEGDPYARLVLLDAAPTPSHADGDVADGKAASGDRPLWRALPCPDSFSWLRLGELAASATPSTRHLPALDALGLRQRVPAEPVGAARENLNDHYEAVVAKAARAVADTGACLLHCTDGFGASGVALACFIIVHGMDEEVKPDNPGQPKLTAPEAIDVLSSMRKGSLATPSEQECVRIFADSAWARHIEKAQRAFCRSAAKIGSGTGAAGATSASAAGGGGPAPERAAPSTARVVPQPGDGNCLFHSLAHGLGQGTAASLRADICSFMEKNPGLLIAGTSLAEWVQMLAGSPVVPYVRKMAKASTWGGAPEIAACAHMQQVNIHVYERRGNGFEQTVPFDVGGSRTIRVLYVGGVHYDALVF